MTRRSIIQVNSDDRGAPGAELLPPQVLHLKINDKSVDEDENDSVASTVSSLSQEEELEDATMQSSFSIPSSPCSTKPRSIFTNYWKTEGECPPKQLLPPRSMSPKCVTMDPYSHQFYSPTMEELLVQQALEEDDDLNTYERTLKDCEEERMMNWRKLNPLASPYENPPLWLSWFSTKTRNHSTRSLPVNDLTRMGGALTRSRQIQSDSALHTKPPASVLRQGRFSQNNQQRATCCTSNAAATTSRHVHFQAQIKIHSYQPPMESWASEGWSEWFGS
mmetsp:Transcript_101485/g.293629  ORF Transcript_101485/g.293629 Transcript_101485/m.293629 type:complete len:277 (+) Transcript_101485:260-1090(+)|eukprot:CAMPEP_0176098576 /NCGR_PEP_ID=MMETSP0120_2-20121206/49428_1 /TAXON_ID=160619 /ORGANISM="Kryptoperidinium foliaceum, Strain CCMP 1326" /LENGTH=276 /DNA_ID=CAMNT_0017432589 /DNA_START=236 /DNA_END=1066 /DNA_ORIENTATION=+